MRSLGFGATSPRFKLIRAPPAELSVTTGLPVSTNRNLVISCAPLADDLSHCCRRADPTMDRRYLLHHRASSLLTARLLPRYSCGRFYGALFLSSLLTPHFHRNPTSYDPVKAVAWSNDDAHIASGGNNTVRVWDVGTGSKISSVNCLGYYLICS